MATYIHMGREKERLDETTICVPEGYVIEYDGGLYRVTRARLVCPEVNGKTDCIVEVEPIT